VVRAILTIDLGRKERKIAMSNDSKERGVFINTTTTTTIVDRARQQAEEHPNRRLLRWIDAQCNVAGELTSRQLWDGAGVGALVLVVRTRD
jgi:hypothetical protein